MNEGIEKAIKETIEEEVSSKLHDLRSVLKDAIRKIYWPSYEKGKVSEKTLMDLDSLVDAVFQTVHRKGPEDESWPAFDGKKVLPIIERIQEALGLDRLTDAHKRFWGADEHKRRNQIGDGSSQRDAVVWKTSS